MGSDDPRAVAITAAIHGGRVTDIEAILNGDPELARSVIVDEKGCGRSLLHIVADWPGHFPNGGRMVHILVSHGADVNARVHGRPHTETPLHWAASSGDVSVLDALLDCGAEIEARGAVIGGGTALADAVAFRNWNAARRLVERGAQANLWQAAALGLLDRVMEHFGEERPPAQEVTKAFWCACDGGQRVTAEYLLNQGADRNWVGYDHLTPLRAARRSGDRELVGWLEMIK